MWNIHMPHASPISFRDCLRAGWHVSTTCDACQCGSDIVNLAPLAAGAAGDKPIRVLFEARKLTCKRCSQPFAGLRVRRNGPTPHDSYEVLAFWREGSSADPTVAAYWQGWRKAKEAG